MLNGLVTTANAGTMPVVGMPSTLHPVSPMWQAATSKTRLPFLADQARLGMFSVGDLVMLFGGILIVVAICLHRTLKMQGGLVYKRLDGFCGPVMWAILLKLSIRSRAQRPKSLLRSPE